jgi:hypothetical protein
MTYNELQYRQSWTLEQKIDHSVGVVSSFLEKISGKAYISYSGGKDSGFGCHVKGDRRFYFLKENKPKIYAHFMQMQNNGVTYKEALRFCGIDFPDGMNRQTKIRF